MRALPQQHAPLSDMLAERFVVTGYLIQTKPLLAFKAKANTLLGFESLATCRSTPHTTHLRKFCDFRFLMAIRSSICILSFKLL